MSTYAPTVKHPLARVNHRGQIIDAYGIDIYEGTAMNRDERYLVWYGHRSGGSANYTGYRTTFRTYGAALKRAKKLEARGYDTKISDRLIPEGTPNA